MPAISFSGETSKGAFWQQIREGRKTQTCRKPRRNPVQKGDVLYLYWKQRIPADQKPIHFIGTAYCTSVKRIRYAQFAYDSDFAQRDGFRDFVEMQEWFGDPLEYGSDEYDVISFKLVSRGRT